MQAFLYRHLAPSRELLVTVTKGRWNALPVTLADKPPVKIPMGGMGKVRLNTKQRRKLHKVELELRDPTKGVTVQDVALDANGLTFNIKVEDDAAEAGFADNLIVEAFVHFPARGKGKKQPAKGPPKMRRVSVGYLPAIPFEVVQR